MLHLPMDHASSRRRCSARSCPHCDRTLLVRRRLPIYWRPLRWARVDLRAYTCAACGQRSVLRCGTRDTGAVTHWGQQIMATLDDEDLSPFDAVHITPVMAADASVTDTWEIAGLRDSGERSIRIPLVRSPHFP